MHPGLIVRALRVASGMRQADLARAADMSRQFLSGIEACQQTLPVRRAQALALALAEPVDVVAGRVPILRSLRIRRGVTPADLAEAAGVTEQELRAYEVGTASPTPDVAARLARRLGADPAVLLEETS